MSHPDQQQSRPSTSDGVGDGSTELTPSRFRNALGHFASGIVVVSGLVDGRPAGLTCQSFSSLSLDPPLILVAPSRTSATWPGIAAAGFFCVNVLAATQEWVCRKFAVSGGNKFDGVEWTPGVEGVPRIRGVLASIDCKLESVNDGGDHHIAIGRVMGLAVQTDAPLLFYRGAYHRLPA